MTVKTLTIDGKLVTAREDDTILQAAKDAGIHIPTLCYLEGISPVGACRLCLVEVNNRLQAACAAPVIEGMVVQTNTPRLQEYRRVIVEMLLTERNHICAVCVANNNCELQDLATEFGIDHVRLEYLTPEVQVDLSHDRYGMDHNRCILCTRCVRVCDEVEGVHTWDVSGRGNNARIISDLHQPWGDSMTCTSCGKCVEACPTGALFHQGSTVAEMERDRGLLDFIMTAREKKEWHV